jgi:arylsulfatase A-like enzyme
LASFRCRPFDVWPNSLGFEYFYDFIGGETDQWHPQLYRNTVREPSVVYDGEHTLDHVLADDAIHWLHQQKAAAPDKPFFLYYATGSGHAPHQAPPDWIAKFNGQFDQGWDMLREQSFARQKTIGVIPNDAVLTPRPPELPAWSSLSPEQQRVYARSMEVFAGMVAYEDAQVGRVLDEIDRMGQRDDTLVVMIEGDNGASGEGSPQGTLNDLGKLANQIKESPGWMATQLDQMGGPHTSELYPAGWAWALNTPFQWMKQVASHLGGMRTGLIVSWPGHVAQPGGLRSQFVHVTDIFPTILDCVGLPAPETVNGVKQQRIDGVSLTYTFNDPQAPERHTLQYFEMLGNRGLYEDGWLANTKPRRMPWEPTPLPGDAFSDYQWELYDLKHDYSQSHDLAADQPERLKAMQAHWLKEAERNNVLPLDDRLGAVRSLASRVIHAPRASNFNYWGGDLSIYDEAAPSFVGRSFSITAEVTVPPQGAEGVLMARGSWFGGWSFYLKDGRPVAYETNSTQPHDQWKVASDAAVAPGRAVIRYDFAYDGGGLGKGGVMHISIDGKEVASGRIERTIVSSIGTGGEAFDVGQDTGVPVTEDYKATGRFTGQIDRVTVDLGALDPELANAAAAVAAKAKAQME